MANSPENNQKQSEQKKKKLTKRKTDENWMYPAPHYRKLCALTNFITIRMYNKYMY